MGGSSSSTEYAQSPQQAALWRAFSPAFKKFRTFFKTEQPLWNLPQLPSFPTYQLPDIRSMMPTGDWWATLDPNLKAGILAPFQDTQRQLLETFAGRGTAGGARGGLSGAFGRAASEYWAREATPQAAMAGWRMISPALELGWRTEAGRRADEAAARWGGLMQQYGQQVQQRTWPWQALTGLVGYGLPYPLVSQGGSPLMGAAGALGGSFLGSMGSGLGSWAAKSLTGGK